MVILACYLLLLCMAAAYDFASLRIPNPLPTGILGLFLIQALADPMQTAWLSHLGAGLLVFAAAALLFAFRLVGGGDAKLIGATALWVGLPDLPAHILLTAVAGGVLGLLLLALRPIAWSFLARMPPAWAGWIPHALAPKAGVPYGVAIAASGILVALAHSG
jgi:prepilin peptidase CpaA